MTHIFQVEWALPQMEYIPLYKLTENRKNNTHGSFSYEYTSWKDFILHNPWRVWNNLEMINYVWTHDNFIYIYYKGINDVNDNRHFKIKVTYENEPIVREWIKSQMLSIWKI